MQQLKTAGELRGFLADVLVGIQSGEIDVGKAHAIAKVAAQINQSLATEVNTALQLEKMGGQKAVAGSMVIASYVHPPSALPPPATTQTPVTPAGPKLTAESFVDPTGSVFCNQCDKLVTSDQAAGCRSPFCKAKVV